jgi:quercetin 2,3-dioxygenase
MASRRIHKIFKSLPYIEGADVHVKRLFGIDDQPMFDPFLLLDDLRNETPANFLKGFPWHPHRGIETITYVLRGEIEHIDSLGHKGTIANGDVQWMTAGSGVIHQEMPKGNKEGFMYAFQVWVNLPAAQKLIEPRYREIKGSEIPTVSLDYGVRAKVIAGTLLGVTGPVKDMITDVEMLDIILPAKSDYIHQTKPGYTTFVYVIRGWAFFCNEKDFYAFDETVVLLSDGDDFQVQTEESPVRFLLFSGKPLEEPIAWSGRIVMNTAAELEVAAREYKDGTFIKHK